MTDLRDFLGSTSQVGRELVYVVDGIKMPDAIGVFTHIGADLAVLEGHTIKIFGVTIAQGKLELYLLDATNARLTVNWQFDGGKPQEHTIYATCQVNPHNAHELDFKETDGSATFFIRQVAGGAGQTNTELFCRDGILQLTAVLVPKD